MPWIIFVVLVSLALLYNWFFDRKQAGTNASKWTPLAPLVAGHVKGNGLQGTYRGRPVTALIDMIGGLSTSWVYTLTLGSGGQHGGKRWKVKCTGAEPSQFGGDEATCRQVLAGVDAKALRVAGFDHFEYRAGKGELCGSFHVEAITLESDIKDMLGAKSPPPPSLEAFTAQLDFLARMAEVNEAANPPA